VSFSPTPGGTGVRKVAAGVETSTASTIVDADVAAGAAIAVAKLAPSGTNGQVLTTTAGVTGWAAAAGGGASAGATSGQVQTGNGAGGFTAPTDVLAGAGFVSFGASPAATGAIRLSQEGKIVQANSGGVDKVVAHASNNSLYLGADNNQGGQFSTINLYSISSGYFGTGSTTSFGWDTSGLFTFGTFGFRSAGPITGNASPYGQDGIGTQAMADANQTPAAAVYAYGAIKTTGALTANRDLTLPTVTDATAYSKWINNTCTGAFSIVLKCVGPGSTVTIANGKSAWIMFDSRGPIRMTADV
jgi:hypothetical protein